MTGRGAITVPIATGPGRGGFGPRLVLGYDSGAGNGPFGLGWHLDLPSVSRRTDKGLPRYFDGDGPDVFVMSGVEDLVPLLDETTLAPVSTRRDALVLKLRDGGRVVNVHGLLAVGVNADGHPGDPRTAGHQRRGRAGWLGFFRDLTARGLAGAKLVTSAAHNGLVAAIGATLSLLRAVIDAIDTGHSEASDSQRAHLAAGAEVVCQLAAGVSPDGRRP